MNRLYYVRHGENPANLTKEFSCLHIDYGLTEKGILQARQTADYFRDKHIHEIYASPLKRARETAEIIAAALDRPVVIMENFREINVGDLETQPVSAENWSLHNRIVSDWLDGKPETRFQGGEDYFTLVERVRSGLRQIFADKSDRNVIVVAHGGTILLPLKAICPNLDLGLLRGRPHDNCAITELEIMSQADRLTAELVTWASSAHLQGAAAELVSGAPSPDALRNGKVL
jgi:probable phosphoglycerate mutase